MGEGKIYVQLYWRYLTNLAGLEQRTNHHNGHILQSIFKEISWCMLQDV